MVEAHGISASTVVCVRLFGPLEVSRRFDGNWQVVPKSAWTLGTPPRSVLKRLLTTPGRRLSRSDIEDDLWPGASMELASHNLHNGLMVIRRVVGADLVETTGSLCGIADQSRVWTDLDACFSLIRDAENEGCTTPEALVILEEALHYFERGQCLEDEIEKWCYAVRADAERLCKQCRWWLATGYEQHGKVWQAGEQYKALTRTLPPDEKALRAWMALLYQQGKPHEALMCYEEAKAFAQERGLPLSRRLDTLARQLEEQCEAAPTIDSFLVPEQATSLWQPDPVFPETSMRLAAWGTLLEKREENILLCDALEVEVLAMALHWRPSSGPIALLQSLTHEIMRKHAAMHKHHTNRESALTRRQALQAIAFLPIQMYGLSYLASEQRVRLPLDEALPLCAAGLTACVGLRKYEPEGMLAIQQILAAYLPTLEKAARQSSHHRAVAASLAGQGYLLVGVLAAHYGKLDQLEAASRMARFYGQMAHDVNLEVAALIRLAIKYDFERLDRTSLETYQEALALPGFATASPLLQSRVYAGLAGTHAYTHQASPALGFLSQAKDTYPQDLLSDPGYPLALSSDLSGSQTGSLALWEGLTLKHTGRHAEAVKAFSRFAHLTPMPGVLEASRAEYLNYTASVAVKQRELDMACLYFDAAYDVAWTIQHSQRLAEARDTFRDIQLLWPHEPKVKMLQEKIYAQH